MESKASQSNQAMNALSKAKVGRRQAMQTMAALTAPMFVSAKSLGLGGHVAASERLTVAMIGCGKMAKDYHLPELLNQKDVAIGGCLRGRSRSASTCGEDGECKYEADSRQGCAEYSDFREVLSRPDIDAVCIATPITGMRSRLSKPARPGKMFTARSP